MSGHGSDWNDRRPFYTKNASHSPPPFGGGLGNVNPTTSHDDKSRAWSARDAGKSREDGTSNSAEQNPSSSHDLSRDIGQDMQTGAKSQDQEATGLEPPLWVTWDAGVNLDMSTTTSAASVPFASFDDRFWARVDNSSRSSHHGPSYPPIHRETSPWSRYSLEIRDAYDPRLATSWMSGPHLEGASPAFSGNIDDPSNRLVVASHQASSSAAFGHFSRLGADDLNIQGLDIEDSGPEYVKSGPGRGESSLAELDVEELTVQGADSEDSGGDGLRGLGELSPHLRLGSSAARRAPQPSDQLSSVARIGRNISPSLGRSTQASVAVGSEAGLDGEEGPEGDVADDPVARMVSPSVSSGETSNHPAEVSSCAGSESPSTLGFWDEELVGRDPDHVASPALDEIATKLVEGYLEATGVSPANEAGIRVVAPGAQGQTSAANTSPTGSRPPRQSRLRRRRGEGRSDGGGGQDSDDEDCQGKPGKKRRSNSPGQRRRLACPYWKLDPRKHRGCFNRKLEAMPRVKYHLLVNHTPEFYCERCHATFTDKEAYQQHVKSETACLPSALDPPHVTYQQRPQLTAKSSPKQSEADQWFTVWDILFPGRRRPSSPYIDGELTEDMCRFREYVEVNGPAIVARAIQDEPQLSRALFAQVEILELVISRGLTMVVELGLSDHDASPQAAAAAMAPLVPAPTVAARASTPTTESTGAQSGSDSHPGPSSQQRDPRTPASSAGLPDDTP